MLRNAPARFVCAAMIAVGGYLIRLSYDEYAKWSEYLAPGDVSGAEVYEIGFRLTALPGFGLLIIGCVLLGMSISRR